MNLKEYNYLRRHHPYAMSVYFGIPINTFETLYNPSYVIHEAHDHLGMPPTPTATVHEDDTSRLITIYYLI